MKINECKEETDEVIGISVGAALPVARAAKFVRAARGARARDRDCDILPPCSVCLSYSFAMCTSERERDRGGEGRASAFRLHMPIDD